MRQIQTATITETVRDLCIRSATELSDDLVAALTQAAKKETSRVGKQILSQLIENANIARREFLPICQDTGMTVVFIEMGQEIHIEGGFLIDAINEGVRRGYADGYLRKSVCCPLLRKNTGDNTPAVVHIELTKGDGFKIQLATKGFGSENMSTINMLSPSEGVGGIFKTVLNQVIKAGPNACPPTIIGVGIGGTFEQD